MGQNPGSLVGFNPTAGSSELAVTSQEQRLAAENLYRDANTLIYGDSNPSEDAIDRVVSKINQEYVSNRYLPRFSTLTFRLASTRKVNSLGSASTRRKEILHTSTSTIASSTKRQAFSLNSVCSFLPFLYIRLRGITTSIRPRYAPVSSEVPLFKYNLPAAVHHCFPATRILVSFLVAVYRTISTPR